jgi:hypothetical protein
MRHNLATVMAVAFQTIGMALLVILGLSVTATPMWLAAPVGIFAAAILSGVVWWQSGRHPVE